MEPRTLPSGRMYKVSQRWRVDVKTELLPMKKVDVPRERDTYPRFGLKVDGQMAFEKETEAITFYRKVKNLVGAENVKVWMVKSNPIEGTWFDKDWVELDWSNY